MSFSGETKMALQSFQCSQERSTAAHTSSGINMYMTSIMSMLGKTLVDFWANT